MNRNLVLGLFAFSLLLFASAAVAFPFQSNIDGPANLSMLRGDTITVPLVLNNVDFKSHNVKIAVHSDSKFIQLKPAFKTMTLAPYQTAQFGVDVHVTDDAKTQSYDVEIIVDADGQITTIPLTVYVGNNPFISVETFEKSVCANEYVGALSAQIQNKTGNSFDATVKATHPILMPVVTPDEISLTGGESVFVDIEVNVSPQQVGDYEGQLRVTTPDIVVVRPFTVKVSDCPTPVKKTISIILPTQTPQLKKLETKLVPITIQNLTNVPQSVTLIPVSVIANENVHVEIGPNQKATVNIALTPGLHVEPGIQKVELTGLTETYSQKVVLNVNVLPLEKLDLEAISSLFSIARGETKTIRYVVSNVGDTPQNITMRVVDAVPGISFTFDQSSFILNKGEQKQVYLSVHANSDTSVTKVNTFIIADGKTDASLPLSFTVTNTPSGGLIPLSIVSYPTDLTLNKGESRTLSVSVYNPNSTAITGVKFTLPGNAEEGIFLLPQAPTLIQPFETKTIELEILVENNAPVSGKVERQLVITSNAGTQKLPMHLTIEDGFGFGLSGLVTFIGERAIWIGLVVLLILGVLWVAGRNATKPVWA